MARWIGLAVAILAAIALLIALGEDGPTSAPTLDPPPTFVPAPPPTAVPGSSTTTTVPVAPEPAAARPLKSPEDARRVLEDEGIDPASLSAEIGEYMDRRFEEKGE